MHQRYGVRPQQVLADGGFVNLADLETAEDAPRGCTVYIPVPQPKDPTRARDQKLATDSAAIAQWRIRTEEAKEISRERGATIECVNAQSRNRGLWRWVVRGVAQVKSVILWMAVAQNVVCGARLRAGLGGLAA
jgi:hypothetical protein